MNGLRFARTPRIHLGAGVIRDLPEHILSFGRKVLLVTGSRSFQGSGHLAPLCGALEGRQAEVFHYSVYGEPSPEMVGQAVTAHREKWIEVVVAIGGGSVLDAGKAISAMLNEKGTVLDYLEGVGSGSVHSGNKVPFIAVPTTAGTGSEATKNAVLSQVGEGGFKKSLRHDNFVPDVALIDPSLSLSCSSETTAACGMDAFTQLLESYCSTQASPMTDALAWSGLETLAGHLLPACGEGAGEIVHRTALAYGALLSGLTLANAGLGVVHGLASSVGGAFAIPHGVLCGSLVGVATSATIRKLEEVHGSEHEALKKYARVGCLLSGERETDVEAGCRRLEEKLAEWTARLKIPRLGAFGISEAALRDICGKDLNKNNAVALDAEEIMAFLKQRI